MKLSLRLSYVSLILLILLSLVIPIAGSAQTPPPACQNCLSNLNIPSPLRVRVTDNELASPPPVSLLTDTILGYSDANGNNQLIPPGSDIQAKAYPAWCVDTPGLPITPTTHLTGRRGPRPDPTDHADRSISSSSVAPRWAGSAVPSR